MFSAETFSTCGIWTSFSIGITGSVILFIFGFPSITGSAGCSMFSAGTFSTCGIWTSFSIGITGSAILFIFVFPSITGSAGCSMFSAGTFSTCGIWTSFSIGIIGSVILLSFKLSIYFSVTPANLGSSFLPIFRLDFLCSLQFYEVLFL